MSHRLITAIFASAAAFGLSARADTVFVRGQEKPVLGNVKTEDAKGIVVTVKKGDQTIPAADVIDVHYDDVKPTELRLAGGAYKVAKDADKDADSADPVKSGQAIGVALAKYDETLRKMQPNQFAARAIQYRIAVLTLRKARADQTSTDKAIAKLQEFKTDFPNSWQINHVMPLIAQLQMDAENFKDAKATFQEMSEMDVLAADVRRDAKLMVVQVSVRAGDIGLAQKQLDALAKEASGNPLFAARVQLARAEVFVGQKKIDQAVPIATQIIATSKDRDIKALAHNTLGECLFKAGRFEEALWEFLWVDAVFNHDRDQHARALYYLTETFQKLNNAERAQECREMLLNDRQFLGTEYQRKMSARTK